MIVTSRSATEYRAMFDLTEQELTAGPVLDCCAGGSSLAAETQGQVFAVDPAYALGHSEVSARVQASVGGSQRSPSCTPTPKQTSGSGDQVAWE